MAAAHAQPAGDAAKGAASFDDRLQPVPHDRRRRGQGPNLAGVVGRKAGSLADFPYTAAMKGSGLAWTPANLQRYLANPRTMVPGTAMTGVTVPSAAERANIVAYLATQKGR